MNIRVDLTTPIRDGTEVVFRSPVDCSQITGLIVYYNGESKEFALADAHGNNVGDIDHLFAENVVVKVILDVAHAMAFVQNADTNAYLENRINGVDLTLLQDLTPEKRAQARENIGVFGAEEIRETLEELHTPVIVNVLPYGKDVPYTIDTDNGNIYGMFSQGIPVYLSYHFGNILHKVPAPLIYATETVAYFSAASANGIVTYTIDNGAFSCTTTHQVFDSVLIGDEENEDKPTAYPGALVTQKAVYDYVNSVTGGIHGGLPSVSVTDSGKILRVSSTGTWEAQSLINAEGVAF